MHHDESPAAELWRRTLSQIPSFFGRLVYLASLRDPNTGIYRHFGFAQRFSDQEADKIMRRSHVTTFADWLCFSLQQQAEDLGRYLDDLGEEKSLIVANWTRFPPFEGFIPAPTRAAERKLFLADMQKIMAIFRKEYYAVSRDPDA